MQNSNQLRVTSNQGRGRALVQRCRAAVRAGQCPCVMGVNQELHKSAQKSQTRSALTSPGPAGPSQDIQQH